MNLLPLLMIQSNFAFITVTQKQIKINKILQSSTLTFLATYTLKWFMTRARVDFWHAKNCTNANEASKRAKKKRALCIFHLSTVAYYSPLLTSFTFTLSAFGLFKLAKLARRVRNRWFPLTFSLLTSINTICSVCWFW